MPRRFRENLDGWMSLTAQAPGIRQQKFVPIREIRVSHPLPVRGCEVPNSTCA